MCYFRCEFGRYALWSGHGCRPVTASKDGIGLFSFPQEPRWNADRDAVEFPVEIGEYRGLAIVPRRLIHDLIGGHATPEQSVEYVFLNRTEFERMVESKIRAKELGADANIHLTGRDARSGKTIGREPLPTAKTFKPRRPAAR